MSYFTTSKFVKELTPADFTSQGTLKNTKCAVVMYYADWCPHCKSLKDEWEHLGKTAGFFDVLAFNCADSNNMEFLQLTQNQGLTEMIQGYPTIIFYQEGEPIEVYHDERKFEKLLGKCMEVCRRGE